MKCSLLLLLLPFLAFAGPKGEEVEKKISREFSIQSNGSLLIDNKYGSIDVAIGESNRIKMDITIKAESSSTRKAQEALDRVQIELSESLNRVEARTEIESKSGWSNWFWGDNVEMEINYQVLVPADIYLELANKYGNIYVETTNRDLRIDLKYGDIRLGDINAKLQLDMAYSEGAISRIQDGDFQLSYSDLEMEDANILSLDMKYTDLVMGSMTRLNAVSAFSDLQGGDIDDLTYSGKYDDIVIDRVKSIQAESAYTGIALNGLSQSGTFDLRYGDLQIDNISAGFSKMNINSSYTGVELDFADNASFTLDAQNNYCDIQHKGLKIMEHIEKGASTTLKASKGSGGGQVVVRMNYGELTID